MCPPLKQLSVSTASPRYPSVPALTLVGVRRTRSPSTPARALATSFRLLPNLSCNALNARRSYAVDELPLQRPRPVRFGQLRLRRARQALPLRSPALRSTHAHSTSSPWDDATFAHQLPDHGTGNALLAGLDRRRISAPRSGHAGAAAGDHRRLLPKSHSLEVVPNPEASVPLRHLPQ
jgi:hypothetical protein